MLCIRVPSLSQEGDPSPWGPLPEQAYGSSNEQADGGSGRGPQGVDPLLTQGGHPQGADPLLAQGGDPQAADIFLAQEGNPQGVDPLLA